MKLLINETCSSILSKEYIETLSEAFKIEIEATIVEAGNSETITDYYKELCTKIKDKYYFIKEYYSIELNSLEELLVLGSLVKQELVIDYKEKSIEIYNNYRE